MIRGEHSRHDGQQQRKSARSLTVQLKQSAVEQFGPSVHRCARRYGVEGRNLENDDHLQTPGHMRDGLLRESVEADR
jgi:hypothetical protein